LGEERLGGRCTEEREESGHASQIPMDDGAPVLRRATGMSSQEGVRDSGGSGVNERRRGKIGTGGRLAFVLKSVSMAQAERERGGVGVGASTWRWEKEESGGPAVVVGSAGRPATAPDHRTWVAPLLHEQRGVAGMGDMVKGGCQVGPGRRGLVAATGVLDRAGKRG
jgi:hypothetical protein